MEIIRSKGGYYYKVYKNGKKKRISKNDYDKFKLTSKTKLDTKTKSKTKNKPNTKTKKYRTRKKKNNIMKGGNFVEIEAGEPFYRLGEGETFDEYFQLLEKMGEGTFGIVYKGKLYEHKKEIFPMQRLQDMGEIAIKFMKYRIGTTSKKMLASVKHEYYTGNLIPQHKNFLEMYGVIHCVTPIIQSGTITIQYIILMEFFEGKELYKVLQNKNLDVTESQKCVIIHQLLIAVRQLAVHGMMHRDLKLQNILVNSDNLQTKIIDYGMCSTNPRSGTQCGTPYYMCPKILANHPPYNKRVDVWSLGAVIFELLANGKRGRGLNNYDNCYTGNDVKTKLIGYTRESVSRLLDTKLNNPLIPVQIRKLLRVMLDPEFNINKSVYDRTKKDQEALFDPMHIQDICHPENEWMDYLTKNIIERIRRGEDVGYFQDAEYFQKELLDPLPKEKKLEVCKQLIEPPTEPAEVDAKDVVAEKFQEIFSVAKKLVSSSKVNNFFKGASLVLNQGAKFYKNNV